MIWNVIDSPLKSGDERYTVKFAWLPEDTLNGTVWLENYVVKEVYRRDGDRWGEGIVIVAMGDGWRVEHVFAQGK